MAAVVAAAVVQGTSRWSEDFVLAVPAKPLVKRPSGQQGVTGGSVEAGPPQRGDQLVSIDSRDYCQTTAAKGTTLGPSSKDTLPDNGPLPPTTPVQPVLETPGSIPAQTRCNRKGCSIPDLDSEHEAQRQSEPSSDLDVDISMHASVDTLDGDACLTHFLSDTTPEALLLAKFRHVYAGKGGWLGVPVSRYVREGTVQGGASPGYVSNRTSAGTSRDGRTVVNGSEGVAKQRAMQKAQYERYKKNIMHRLANTNQGQTEGAETQRGTGRARGKNGQGQPTQVMAAKDKLVSMSTPDVTLPAHWHLPVGWAGRDKVTPSTTRRHPWQYQGVRRLDDHQHSQHQLSAKTARQHTSMQDTSLHRDAALHRLATEPTIREHSHFTSSWMPPSGFNGALNTSDNVGFDNVDDESGIHPYTLQLGSLLHQDPGTVLNLVDSNQNQTERVDREAMSMLRKDPIDTSRTAVTHQSLPQQATTSGRARDRVSIMQKRKRKSPQSLRNVSGRIPVSSRRSTHMFSRMSLEAQAALKEMGMQAGEETAAESEDTSSGAEVGDQSLDVEEVKEFSDKDIDALIPGSNNNSKGRIGSTSIYREKAPKRETDNSVTPKGHRLSKPTVVYHMKPSPNGVKHRQENSQRLKATDNRRHDSTIHAQPVAQRQSQLEKTHSDRKEVMGYQQDDDHRVGTSNVGAGNGSGISKQGLYKMRAGVSLKDTSNALNKQPAITLRIAKSQNNISHGHDTHSNKRGSQGTVTALPGNEQDLLRVSLSQVSKSRMCLPDIRESPTANGTLADKTNKTESTTPFKGTHRQIPGVGQYAVYPSFTSKPLVIKNWARENTFEITPAGYDSRFEDMVQLEEQDETPGEVKEKAFLKCTDWLQKYYPNT